MQNYIQHLLFEVKHPLAMPPLNVNDQNNDLTPSDISSLSPRNVPVDKENTVLPLLYRSFTYYLSFE